jgi:2'-5' RNA ligase
MNIQRSDENTQKARLFFALWPATALRDRLYAEAQACSKQHGGRAMQRETLHMTLLFLGDVMRERIPELVRQVDSWDCEPFAFGLGALQCWRHNRIAYAGLEEDVRELHQLATRLQDAAEAAGVAFDRRAFTPHVTLVRKLEKPFEATPIELPQWDVSGFALVESLLQVEGPRYRDLYAWPCR